MDDVIDLKNIKKIFLASKNGILEKIFGRKPVYVNALDDVNLQIKKGTTLGVVGESGSGKTTLAKIIATLEEPTSGELIFEGREIKQNNSGIVRDKVSMVFQNPATSVNPRMKVIELLTESLGRFDKDKINEVLVSVGLNYEDIENKDPRELSGGQIQRIAIARALIKNPEVIILDEPTSALDESVQAQILNILANAQKDRSLTYLFITHNILVARYISDFIIILYSGKIFEYGPTEKIISKPLHPYTQLLMSSIPTTNSKILKPPEGDVPSLIKPPAGCRFHPRCPFVMEKCKTEEPKVSRQGEVSVSCWLYA
jgi:peptide/nickel transport system ATP-binding protein